MTGRMYKREGVGQRQLHKLAGDKGEENPWERWVVIQLSVDPYPVVGLPIASLLRHECFTGPLPPRPTQVLSDIVPPSDTHTPRPIKSPCNYAKTALNHPNSNSNAPRRSRRPRASPSHKPDTYSSRGREVVAVVNISVVADEHAFYGIAA